MEDRVEVKSIQPKYQTLDREMDLSCTTITTKTKGVALVMSNDYVAGLSICGGDNEIKIHEESKRLSECLHRSDYFVYHSKNIAKQEFIKLCQRLAEYKYPSNCKRLVVAFSGRGFDGVLQLRDGERIFLEDVVGYFKSNNVTLPSMTRLFFIDTHHGTLSSVGSLGEGDSVIVKAGGDCKCLRRIEMVADLLVAYSSIRHDNDVENFSLYGKWTGCLAAELDKSRFTSLQNVLTIVNKTMADIATVAKYFQTADYCSSTDHLYILPIPYATSSTTVDVSSSISRYVAPFP